MELILFIIIVIESCLISYLIWRNRELTYYIKIKRKQNELKEMYGDDSYKSEDSETDNITYLKEDRRR